MVRGIENSDAIILPEDAVLSRFRWMEMCQAYRQFSWMRITKAWLDLLHRKSEGEQINSRNIRKHKNDVFRLTELLD